MPLIFVVERKLVDQPLLRSRLFIPGRLVLNLNKRGVPVQMLKGPSYLQSTAPVEIGLAARMHRHKMTAYCRIKRHGGFDAHRIVDVPSGIKASILVNLGARFIYRTQGSKAA
jgi:hypothetical protein